MRLNLLAFLSSVPCIIAQGELIKFPSQAVPLTTLFNNQAASLDGSADFDGHGSSFDSQFLPEGPWVHDGISYDLPERWGSANDNVIADGQILTLEDETYVHELHLVYSGDASGGSHEFVANFVLNFNDDSTQLVQLYARNFWRWPILNTGDIQTPYSFVNHSASKNFNASQIYQWSTSVLSEKPLKSITFPTNNPSHRLHLFAMSISASSSISSKQVSKDLSLAFSIRRARFTSRWEMIHGQRAQAVEVTLANLQPSFMLSRQSSITTPHQISISAKGLKTVSTGTVFRLVPGDQSTVDVFVVGAQDGDEATVDMKDGDGNTVGVSGSWPTKALIEKWSPDAKVLSLHETPTWWNKAKFGIFIHWGVYSAPAWAPAKQYAEWYDWYLHNPPNSSSPTWNHHLETYVQGTVYDDFIANFTASKFNASEWVDVFDRAGAKYFVLVTKHHDGFALFDTGNTTHRSSVSLGPQRDLVKELLDTAKKEKPELHRGTYYSLPEWFNPDYAAYGFGQWPGGLAHNAFNTSSLEPYTGRLEIQDYIEDLQLPQMLDLATKYDTEIMWCDIGGPNKTLEFAAQFYNHALQQGRQVTMNNRCGAVPDFDTPEYATFGAIQTRKWESSEGMDPFSYGLNSVTNASQYKNGTTIVQTLVDIISKNGNFLLDIGPNAEGEIIDPMKNNLLDAGKWLGYSGDCVYDTHFWFPGSQDISGGSSARFVTTPKTFCIVAFNKPTEEKLVIHKRLPLLPGDSVFLLQPGGQKQALSWSVDQQTGELTVHVSQSALDSVEFAWAFAVEYKID